LVLDYNHTARPDLMFRTSTVHQTGFANVNDIYMNDIKLQQIRTVETGNITHYV